MFRPPMMKSASYWAVALLFTLQLACGSTTAFAGLLFYESFDYPDNVNLTNQQHQPTGNFWRRPTAPTGSQHVIDEQSVPYAGLLTDESTNALVVPRPSLANTSANRLDLTNKPHNRAGGESLYFSFTMKMTAFTNFAPPPGNPSDTKNDAAAKTLTHRRGGYIAGFHGGAALSTTAMSDTGGFGGVIYIRRELGPEMGTDGTPGTQTGRYEFGINKQVFTSASIPATDLAFDTSQSFGVGETVLVVGQYDFVDSANGGSNDVARIWINPTPGTGSATPTWTSVVGTPNLAGALDLESFFVRSDTNSPGPLVIDNVRVGTTFQSVIPAIPEPSAIVLLAVGALVGSVTKPRKR